jgi:two-component system, cell cycle sensor histidine kinase and response regulator CckA
MNHDRASPGEVAPQDEHRRLRERIADLERELEQARFAGEATPQPTLLSVDQAPFSILQLDSEGRIVYANESACEKLGYSRRELLAMTVQDLDPDLSGDLWRSFWRDLGSSGSLFFESRQRHKSGRLFPVEMSAKYFEAAGRGFCCTYSRDITERKRAEESLRESEERYRSLFENMQEGFAYCRMLYEGNQPSDFVYLAVNDAFEPLTGLKGVLGRRVTEVIPGIQETNPELFQIYGRVASTGKPEVFESYVAPLGEWFRVSVYRPREGHFVAIFRNITESKAAGEALRDTNRRLRLAAASAHLGIWDWDIQAGAVTLDARMFELYGISRTSFNKTYEAWLSGLHPDDVVAIHRAVQAALQGEKEYDVEFRVVHPDGAVRYIKADGMVVRDADGRATRMIGLSRDITESRQAAARLYESENRFRQVVEVAPEGIYVQIDGNFRYLNPAAVALFGAETPAQLIGLTYVERIHPDHRAVVAARVRLLSEERKAVPLLEEQYLRLDGTAFDVEVTAAPLTFEGRVGSIVFFRDITARKQAEEDRSSLQEQFHQAQKMESIGQLAGGVAHDFNNLLTVINGYSDLLLSTLKTGDPVRDKLAEIRKAGRTAAGLTQQLLAFSRRQVLDPRPLDLNDLVTDTQEMLQRLVGERIVLVTILAPSLGLVMADHVQTHQVLMNLVVNARDAMPAGGRLTIRTQNIEVNQGLAAECPGINPGPYVLLTVADTGAGIDSETRPHIFEPFFTTKGEGKGTGLGLSTVYGIVRQLGGGVLVESEVGKGTTFRIYIPQSGTEVPPAAVVPPASGTVRGSETVLVVEDQEEVRKMVVAALESRGYCVLEAARGGDALLLAEHHRGPIHLMVTDVVMPQMNGKELAERLKPLRPETKVLYVSGYGENLLADQGVLDPGVYYLPKPFTSRGLAAKVRTVLDATPKASILVVDDSAPIRSIYREILEDAGYQVREADTAAAALAQMDDFPADLVMADLNLGGQTGVALIAELRRAFPKVKTILMSAAFDDSGACSVALAKAADKILPKSVDSAELCKVIATTLT